MNRIPSHRARRDKQSAPSSIGFDTSESDRLSPSCHWSLRSNSAWRRCSLHGIAATMLVLAGMLATSGCAPWKSGSWQLPSALKSFRPHPSDYRDTTEDFEDQWSSVGEEGRGDRPREKDPDPLRNVLMSRKARAIERNLGIE